MNKPHNTWPAARSRLSPPSRAGGRAANRRVAVARVWPPQSRPRRQPSGSRLGFRPKAEAAVCTSIGRDGSLLNLEAGTLKLVQHAGLPREHAPVWFGRGGSLAAAASTRQPPRLHISPCGSLRAPPSLATERSTFEAETRAPPARYSRSPGALSPSRSMLRTLLLALGLASASALVMPATRPVATLARAGSSPQMQADELHRKGHVVRIQIELEQGEP